MRSRRDRGRDRHRAGHATGPWALTPAVAKAAAGALEHLPVAFVSGIPGALDRAERAGVWCVGLDADGDQFALRSRRSPTSRSCSCSAPRVVGCHGSRATRCDVIASIPMHGHIESLNVSAAAAVAMHRDRASTSSDSLFPHAGLAQSVEHFSCKEDVVGSIPTPGSRTIHT